MTARYTSESVELLVEQLMKLPTVGRKTAQRLAAYILKMSREDVAGIAQAMLDVKDRVKQCSTCYNVTDHDPCWICSSTQRDRSVICVVEESNDVLAVERTNDFRGVYHVLGGVISPLDGVGPEELRIRELVHRIRKSSDDDKHVTPAEIILALNPTVEGDTTAFYISQLLDPFDIHVTRIARGLPIGGDLEFADEATLSRALEGRATL